MRWTPADAGLGHPPPLQPWAHFAQAVPPGFTRAGRRALPPPPAASHRRPPSCNRCARVYSRAAWSRACCVLHHTRTSPPASGQAQSTQARGRASFKGQPRPLAGCYGMRCSSMFMASPGCSGASTQGATCCVAVAKQVRISGGLARGACGRLHWGVWEAVTCQPIIGAGRHLGVPFNWKERIEGVAAHWARAAWGWAQEGRRRGVRVHTRDRARGSRRHNVGLRAGLAQASRLGKGLRAGRYHHTVSKAHVKPWPMTMCVACTKEPGPLTDQHCVRAAAGQCG